MNSLLKLWEYSPFRCVDTDIVEWIIKRPNGNYKIYNIAVHFSATDIKSQYRELVLIINERGIIDDIYIAIDIKDKEKLIKESSDPVDSKNRLALLDFLENITNAIKRKDLNFISNFFGDDTLFLSELHKAKAQKENHDFKTNIDPLKITKKAYLDNLKNSIKNEEFKDVIFRDIVIEKHPKFNHIYGISFVQSLPGSNFNHESYVFFIIDYYYDNQPKLCYRTCQPVSADNKLLKEEEKMKLNKIQFKE